MRSCVLVARITIETVSVESVCIICHMSPQHNTMLPEPLLLTPLPDVVHIGKSLRCSWSNWFIDLNGQISNLVLIRKLRDSTDSDVRKLLRPAGSPWNAYEIKIGWQWNQ